MATLRVPEVVPSPEKDRERLQKAFQGWGTDEKAIIDTRDARLANEALKARKKKSGGSSRDGLCFIASPSDGVKAGLLFSVRLLTRRGHHILYLFTTLKEALHLNEAIEGKQLDHDDVVRILSTRNVHQLRATFDCYKEICGSPIDRDIIGKGGKSDLGSLLQTVILCLAAPEKHFAEVIRAAIVGLGTDEDSLTRVIIRGEYFVTNKTSLDNAVIRDTRGDYKDFLMTFLGARI
ncbi:LOW QUALITY PROTEIN: Annexin repeat [Dillenia turbinata]|uniref:Annexin repeat n=1 Tax=Dillenia turbinata TaxID=194707 RepID=A0AAN8VLE5_9MAGN